VTNQPRLQFRFKTVYLKKERNKTKKQQNAPDCIFVEEKSKLFNSVKNPH